MHTILHQHVPIDIEEKQKTRLALNVLQVSAYR